MGMCKYCGEDAGWFSSQHQRCKEANRKARRAMMDKCRRAAASGQGNEGLRSELERLAAEGYVDQSEIPAMMMEGWGEALEDALSDHVLSRQELRALNAFRRRQGIADHELEAHGHLARLRQAILLRSLFENGAIPKRPPPKLGETRERLPFNMMKSESLLWVFHEVDYMTEVVNREFRAGHSGVSLRVARGVYYRTGGSRGRTITTRSMEVVDAGIMGITTKHIYWAGQQGFGNSKSFRIRLNRIASFEPYSDGVALFRDTQTAKPEAFRNLDGPFAVNLLQIASYKLDEDGFTKSSKTLEEMMEDEDAGLAFAAGEAQQF